MKKITTLSELAKECNCSTATVSYVLNGRNDQRISEETKQKVLQMANLFQYRINPYAKALATGELHNILFFYEDNEFALAKADTLNFIDRLSTFLKHYKYNVVVAPINHVQTFRFVDAILTYRITKKTFLEIGNKNYVPVIAIDSQIKDNIFFEVNNDFHELTKDENIVYLSIPYHDSQMNDFLSNKVNVIFIESFMDLQRAVQENQGKQFVTFSKEIKQYLDSLGIESTFHMLDTDEKFNAILTAITASIERNDNAIHQINI